MKQYLEFETCKKLVALGCTSQSGFVRIASLNRPIYIKEEAYFTLPSGSTVPAFEFEDLAGPSEHAYKNRDLIWNQDQQYMPDPRHYDAHSERMCAHGADWIKIIEEAVNNA